MAVEEKPPQTEQRRVWSEMDWERLLNRITKEREVVPVIGPDLMVVEVGAADIARWNEAEAGKADPASAPRPPASDPAKAHAVEAARRQRVPGFMRLESYLTLRLAEIWDREQRFPRITPADLSLEPRFNDFVCLYLDRRGDRDTVATFYDYITILYESTTLVTAPDAPLGENVVRLSPAILQLARITDFKLFITTTGDGLLEHALKEVRPGKKLHEPSPAFSNEQPKDLPVSAISGQETAVYHLFGVFDRGDHSFVMTEEDLLNYVAALQMRDASLTRLNHALRKHRLLILGGGFHDWLARFFLRAAKAKLVDSEDVLADSPALDGDSLRLFLQRFSPKSEVIGGGGAKFVDDLYTRWSRRRPGAGGATTAATTLPPAVMPGRTVFISYASEDRERARSLWERLAAMGVKAWFDAEQLESGDHWDQKIRRNVGACTVFVPLISPVTEQRLDGYFRIEWNAAEKCCERKTQELNFIFPLAVDQTVTSHGTVHVPEAFKKAQWARFDSSGSIPQSFLDGVVAAHHQWLGQPL